jgi:hypothetical protein
MGVTRKPVMPAQAGIHDLTIRLHRIGEKSWMPACAGMTVKLLRGKPNVSWYYRISCQYS